MARYQEELSREMDVALAITAVELDSRNATLRTRESAMGNVIADAMRDATGADGAIMNGGGIRSGKVYAVGAALTRRDVLAELPFSNRMVVLPIRGSDLRAALEAGLSRQPNAFGGFPQVSGMTVRFDPRRPVGQRITSLSVGGAPLAVNRVYNLATNDYLARGGDGYVTFETATPTLPLDDAPLLANAVMSYLRKLGTVRTGVSDRIHAQ